MTTDLTKTGNKEFFNDTFRFTLEDTTHDKSNKKIHITAYDIDYST